MISNRDPRWKNASEASAPIVAAAKAEVIPSVQWKHKATGATASLYGAVPWSGSKGDEKADWEKVEVGWTIRHPDGTIGIGKPPFHTKEEAEKWVETHPKFQGMNVYASHDRWKTAEAGSRQAAETLECAGDKDCKEPVSMIDNKGWTYCTKHGDKRKSGGTPCRKMKPAEIKKLEEGGSIKYT